MHVMEGASLGVWQWVFALVFGCLVADGSSVCTFLRGLGRMRCGMLSTYVTSYEQYILNICAAGC